ncbi:MAG TPA: TetR/AcrR family transcriptional regulator [Streptosporangiaceae bacterium]
MSEAVKPVRRGDARRERWTSHRAQRHREFVDAALRVLEAAGPGLLMDSVAAEAGVSKPVLYRYFSDKTALIQALDERASHILLDQLMPAIEAATPPRIRVRDSVGAYFAVIDEHPNLYWLLARQANSGGPGSDAIQRYRDFVATALSVVIGEYLARLGLDPGAAEPWAHGITGLVQSTGEWWLRRRSMNRAQVVEYVAQLIWAALSQLQAEAGIAAGQQWPSPPARPGRTARAGRSGGNVGS